MKNLSLFHITICKEVMAKSKICLERLSDWFIENKLSLIIEKSNHVIYHSPKRWIRKAFSKNNIQKSTIKQK